MTRFLAGRTHTSGVERSAQLSCAARADRNADGTSDGIHEFERYGKVVRHLEKVGAVPDILDWYTCASDYPPIPFKQIPPLALGILISY